MKKLLALLVTLVLAFSLLAVGAGEEEPTEITVILWANGTAPASDAMAEVNEKLNEITIPLINTKVDVQIWNVGSYIGTAATAVGTNEDIDLMCTFAAAAPHYSSMSAQNMLLPLDELLEEYAPDIMNLIPAAWWPATSKDGKILGVPVYANKAQDLSIMFVKEWFDELGLNIEEVKTLEDIHAVLAAFKEKHPDKLALSGDNLTLDFTYPGYEVANNGYHDALGDRTAVAAVVQYQPDGSTDYKVISRYETEAFNTVRKTLQTWYNEGLIDKDTITNNGNGFALQVNANAFASISVTTPSVQATRNKSLINGEAYVVKLMSGAFRSDAMMQFTWALPSSCDEPEGAVKFMNLLYSHPEVRNLICYGIEGTHYVLNAEGQMELPEGMTTETSPYFPNCFNFTGNTLMGHTWAGTDPMLPQLEEEAMKSAIVSPLLGFTFNTSNISDIYSVLGALAHDEYGPAVFTGAASDAFYQEFIDKLYENGLQTFIDELQTQVDAWVAANK